MSRIFESTKNTRPILPGSYRFIRSDVPTKITERELAWLIERNITTVVDLRGDEERNEKPCPLENDSRFQYHCLPVTGGNKVPDCAENVALSYIEMVDIQMSRIVETILTAPSNVLYFCSAGKDRTGVVSAMLLLQMGMDEEYIIEDYMKSKDNLMDVLLEAVAKDPTLDIDIITPRREYMREFLLRSNKNSI